MYLVVVHLLNHVQLFASPWTVAQQVFLSFTLSLSLLKLNSIELMMPSTHLILFCPLPLLSSIFPSIRVYIYILLSCSVVSDSETPWAVAHQAPLSMEFSRQEYWSRLLFFTPGDLSDPGIKTVSLAPPPLAGRFFTTAPPGKPILCIHTYIHIYIYI